MIFRKSYKRKLFTYFFSVFIGFMVIISVFQFKREKEFKISELESSLDYNTELVNRFIEKNQLEVKNSFQSIDSLISIIPNKYIRVSIINAKGKVLYDSEVKDVSKLENHLQRPEIQKSLYADFGYSVRKSTTTGVEYFYYAKNYHRYFIRTAAIYNVEVMSFLKIDKLFIGVMILLFIVMLFSISYLSDKFSLSIEKLRDISVKAARYEDFSNNYDFPDTELGTIGKQIAQIYNDLKTAKDKLVIEKEKLFRHLQIINEGIAIFSATKQNILSNNHFIQFVNFIADKPAILPTHIFDIEEFSVIHSFVNKFIGTNEPLPDIETLRKELTIEKNGKYFSIQCVVFHDKSFEIIITDITKLEKRKLLKQELTSNISHELKTPVSSVIGYLETILNYRDMEPEKKTYFVSKAYLQALRLSQLINDISILNKIEEAGSFFEKSNVNLLQVVKEVEENMGLRLKEKNISVHIKIANNVEVEGNKSLLNSIFQNLIENSINYAGEGIEIRIENYFEDSENYYFNYSDTGRGIPDEHLHRIFERFYRIENGRSRKEGGTGLGLAIVKNAVLYHKGDISVKNIKTGGVEFMFSLKKNQH